MIELALLGLLHDQDLHGYELKKQLVELLGPWSTVSFGSLYPALGRLERAGSVRVLDGRDLHLEPAAAGGSDAGRSDAVGLGAPMTGALSGELAAFRNRRARTATIASAPADTGPRPRGRRGKKVYAITPAGRSRFTELLSEPTADDDRSFSLRVAFCRHLPVDERLALFERRKTDLTTQLATRRRAGTRRTDPYLRSLGERDARALAHDLAWIDELIVATRGLPDEPVAPVAAHPPSSPPPASSTVPPSPSLAELGAAARRAGVKEGSNP